MERTRQSRCKNKANSFKSSDETIYIDTSYCDPIEFFFIAKMC